MSKPKFNPGLMEMIFCHICKSICTNKSIQISLDIFNLSLFSSLITLQLLNRNFRMKSQIILFLTFYLANAGCPFSSTNEEPVEAPKDVADPETTTPNGCTCTSLCGASADDLFKVYVSRQVYQRY